MTPASNLKKDIIAGVKTIDDEIKLNKILSFIFQDKIQHQVKILMRQKMISGEEVYTHFEHLMINAPGVVTDKLDFLEEIKTKGGVNIKKLLNEGVVQNLSTVLKTKYPIILNSLAPAIINWTPQISSATIGRGEMFFFLFAKKIYQGNRGDLVTGGEEIEVKGNMARMVSTKGYATTPSIYKEYFYSELKAKYPKADKNPNFYNFNRVGIQNLSDAYVAIGDSKWVRNHLKTTFQKLYLEAKPALINKFIKGVMNQDGSLNTNEFILNFYCFQFEYYKQLDGWDGILFINPKNMNLLYIKTAECLRENLQNFKTSMSFSWKEGRCISYQLTLR